MEKKYTHGKNTPAPEVAALFKAVQDDPDPDLTTPPQVAKIVLEQLGFDPTEEDVSDAVKAARVAEDEGTLDAKQFVEWYKASVFGASISECLGKQLKEQVLKTVLDKRNEVLTEVLQIPEEKWGFDPKDIGTGLPKLDVFKQPALDFGKLELRNVWRAQVKKSFTDRLRSTNDASGEPAAPGGGTLDGTGSSNVDKAAAA